MIKEYAVDPAALDSYEIFFGVIEKFGVCNGRVISRFPKRWPKMLYDSIAKLPQNDRKDIEIKVESLIKRKKIIRSGREYVSEKNWVDNALKQQNISPFHAIITNNECDIECSLTTRESLDNDHTYMRVNRSPRVHRQAKEMAQSISSLLLLSRKIIFIDPYFEFLNERHIKPLLQFLQILTTHKYNISEISIEYHIGNTVPSVNFERNLIIKLLNRLPVGLNINFIRWPSEKLHNRYVLTDIGGVMFGTGLDEDEDGSIPNDIVSLLDEDSYEALWAEYAEVVDLDNIMLSRED